jgi:hypothetical protein
MPSAVAAAAEHERVDEPSGSASSQGRARAPQPQPSTPTAVAPAGGRDVARGSLLLSDKPQARIMQMSPARARAILETCNTHNRSCEDRRVAQYAEDMRRDGWLFTGEAIKISREGVLLDGQHRLYAVLEADVTVPLLLITGLDPRAQEVMDQGKPRSLGDAMHLRGEPDPYNLAAALRTIAHFYRDGVPFQMGRAPGMSHGYALRLFDRGSNREDLHAALKFVRNRLKRGAWMSLSQMTALHFLFCAADEPRALAFTAGLLDGSSTVPAVRELRRRLLEEYERSSEDAPRAHIKTRTVYIVQAWNAPAGTVPAFTWRHADGFPGIFGISA